MSGKKCVLFSVLVIFSFVLTAKTIQNNRQAVLTASEDMRDCVIILDAGHGGFDGGTVSADGTLEKDINLRIVQKLALLCKAAGLQTILTRTDDNSIHDAELTSVRKQKVSDIRNRLHIMEQTENSIFVSIHQNHFTQAKYRGTQVFYSGTDPRSKALAQSIQNAVIRSVQPDNTRAIKQSGTEIYLLYRAVRPAVMVECGFLSNPEETDLLKTDSYQQRIALAILKGIVDFQNNTEVV